MMRNDDGTFAAGATYQPSTTLPAPTVFTGITAGSLGIADVTGDGKPDLISTNYRTNSFSEVIVYPGNGDGTFQFPSVYQTTAQAEFLSVADLNGDGRQDLVITSPSTSMQLSAIQILNGSSGPYLRMNITSNSPIYMDQASQFSVTVTNLGDQPTSGEIDVTPGAAVSSQNTIGPVPPASGWNCASVSMGNFYGAQCSRSDVLAPGASYPPIPVNGGVPQYGNPTTPTLRETVSGGGSARASGGAVVSLIPLNSVCPFTTPNPQMVGREGGTFSAPLGSSRSNGSIARCPRKRSHRISKSWLCRCSR
jgi:FG-GAP-like repeat